MYGYAGKILEIDLTNKKFNKIPIDKNESKKYIGGMGEGYKLALKYFKKGVDALASENPIIFSAGVLVGTKAHGSPKFTAITKFPLYASKDKKQFIGASASGGDFGIMMKKAGYDHIIITGKSEEPVCIEIVEGEVFFSNGSNLWGKKNIYQTTDFYKEKYGKDCSVIAIGKPGENLVRHSFTYVDKHDSLGRPGLGAVFGSKKIKAISCKGTGEIKVSDKKRFNKVQRVVGKRINEWHGKKKWEKMGLGAGWDMFKYTQYPGKWPRDKWDKLYGEKKRIETIDKIIGCPSCPIQCKIRWKIKDGEFKGHTAEGSPYGKSATSGQLLDVEDQAKMLELVIIGNMEGLDFYTTTRLMDFVTTLYKEGKITKKDTGGYELKRDFNTYLDLFNKTMTREGFGDLMADGWMRIAEEFNVDPQDYWYGGIEKGEDFIYDPRAAKFHPLMMMFITNPRPHHGGGHTLTVGPGKSLDVISDQVKRWGIPKEAFDRIFTPADYYGKFNVGRYTKYMEESMVINNSLGVCSILTGLGFVYGEDYSEYYSSVTGIEMSNSELMAAAEVAFNIKKLLNVREGFTRSDDKIPELWLRPMKTPEGVIETKDYFDTKVLTENDIKRMLDDYYDERDWDIEKGIPTDKKLAELGLENIG
ncbi:MAG: aldehyde ferredoxin oxidoreductase C-terminal domain-containing protein [Actinomycetota bacterium]